MSFRNVLLVGHFPSIVLFNRSCITKFSLRETKSHKRVGHGLNQALHKSSIITETILNRIEVAGSY